MLLLLPLLLLATSLPARAAVTLDITGVDDELAENVRLTVGQPRRYTKRSIERYIDNIPEAGQRALAALGYYGATVDAQLVDDGEATQPAAGAGTTAADGDAVAKRQPTDGNEQPADAPPPESGQPAEPEIIVAVSIDPGEPTRTQNIRIAVNGAAAGTDHFRKVIADSPLKRGRIFISSDYESTKSALLDRAQDLGYFDFEFTTTSVRVSRQSRTADIDLQASSGPRYTFGPVKLEQDIFSDGFLRRWVPFEEGEPFDSEKVATLTENLQKSNYFSSVRVLPQQDRRYGKTVPVIIRLERRPNNLVGVGIGFSTDDDGLRGKLTWDKPLVNRYGHSFNAELGVSRIRQSLSMAYRIPRRNKPLTNYFSLEYGLQNLTSDPKSFLSKLNFQRVRQIQSNWRESVFIRWEREKSTIGGREIETDLVLPGVSYVRSRAKGVPYTRWGQSEAFTVMYGNENLLSTINFLKSTLNLKFLRSLSDRNTYILGLQYGAIETNDYDLVPTSQRFFAGGDNTIRGFKFRDVGPRNPEGDPVGGRYLEVASLEYQYHFLPLWAVATFVDAGRAFNNFDEAYSAGAGFGIRWQSPVGPFSIDLATPISGEDSGIRVHLSLGPEIR